VDRTGGAAVLFKSTTNSQDHTIDIFTSDNGSEGTKISINRSALLSALTVQNHGSFASSIYQGAAAINANVNNTSTSARAITFASEDSTTVLNLEAVSMQVFEQALSNIAFLRAEAGGSMSRLQFAAESIAAYETNMRAALGRIEDVDIAEESANLAKYSILTQASAAMVSQANSSNDVALMLLR
jgi:flagellin